MTESQASTFFEVRLDVFAVDFGLVLVRSQNHYDVSVFDGVGGVFDFKSSCGDFLAGRAVGTQANDYFDATVPKVLGMSVAL